MRACSKCAVRVSTPPPLLPPQARTFLMRSTCVHSLPRVVVLPALLTCGSCSEGQLQLCWHADRHHRHAHWHHGPYVPALRVIHTHARTRTCAHTLAHTRTRAHTRTHASTHTRAHAGVLGRAGRSKTALGWGKGTRACPATAPPPPPPCMSTQGMRGLLVGTANHPPPPHTHTPRSGVVECPCRMSAAPAPTLQPCCALRRLLVQGGRGGARC